MKSANCISATGRIPFTERPMAEPTIRLSASGVSITLAAPNSSCNPCVTLKTPPALPTSSPSTITDSSERISSASPSWMAWSRFFVAIGIPKPPRRRRRGRLGVGERGVLCVFTRLCDLSLYALRDLISLRLVQDAVLHQILLEADDGVLLAPLLYLLALAVSTIVVV